MSDVILRIQSSVAQGVAGVKAFKDEMLGADRAAIKLGETVKASTAEILAAQQKQIAGERAMVESYQAQIASQRELTGSYKKGSIERQLSTKAEIDLQHRLQAALGETAVASTRVAKASRVGAEESAFLRGASSRSGVVGTGMAAFAGPGFIAGAVVGGTLDYAVKAAQEEQVVQANLRNSLKATGQQRAISRKQLEEYVVAEEHATGFTRDQVIQTLSIQIRATGDLAKAQRNENLMADIARARQTDLAGAQLLVLKASMGNAGALRRLGIDVQKVTTHVDALKDAHLTSNVALARHARELDLAATKTEVMRAVTQKFSGDSAAYMHTFAGASAALRNTVHDLFVELGDKAIPVLTRLFSWFQREIEVARQSDTLHKTIAETVKILKVAWAGLTTIVQTFFDLMHNHGIRTIVLITAAVWALDAAVMANPWVAAAAAALLAVGEIRKHWAAIATFFTRLWDTIKAIFFYAWDELKIASVQAILDIIEPFSHLPGSMGKWARDMKDELHGQLDLMVADARKQGEIIGTFAGSSAVKAAQPYWDQMRIGFNQSMTGADIVTPGAFGYNPAQSGKGVQIPTSFRSTHDTKGLPGFPAVDIMAKPGTPILAPENGMITRLSGRDPAEAPPQGQGGPWGLSLYFVGTETGNTYFMTHLMKVGQIGHYKKGDVIGIIGDYPGSSSDHVHVGLHQGASPESGFGSSFVPPGDVIAKPGSKPPVTTTRPPPPPAAGQSAADRAYEAQLKAAQQAAAAAKARGRGVKAPTLTGIEGQIAAELRALPDELDPVEKAAVAHIKKIRASLHVGMSAEELAKDRVELAKWGKVLHDEISKNATAAKKAAAAEAKRLKESAREAAKAWQAGWTADTAIIARSIAESWARVQQTFDRQTQANLTRMQRDAQAGLTRLQRAFQTQMAAFDRETSIGLAGLTVTQTPEEQALQAFLDQRQATVDQTAANQRAADLAAAISGGDPDQIRQAQDAINQAALDEQEKGLQKAAEASRVAADAKTAADQQAYQDQRDALKQSLEDQEGLVEQSYQDRADAAAQAYSDQRAAQWQALNDLHDDQVAQFNADLDLWNTWLTSKKKSWADFLAYLQRNPVSAGFDGSTITNPGGGNAGVVGGPTGVGGGPGTLGSYYGTLTPFNPTGHAAGGIHMRPTVGMLGDQGPEATLPLTGQRGQAMVEQLAAAIAAAGGGSGAGVQVVFPNAIIPGRDRDAARRLARMTGPEISRAISYRSP